MMKLRLAQPKHLIDLRKVPGLTTIKDEGGMIPTNRSPASLYWERFSCSTPR